MIIQNINDTSSWPAILEESRKAGHSGMQMDLFE